MDARRRARVLRRAFDDNTSLFDSLGIAALSDALWCVRPGRDGVRYRGARRHGVATVVVVDDVRARARCDAVVSRVDPARAGGDWIHHLRAAVVRAVRRCLARCCRAQGW